LERRLELWEAGEFVQVFDEASTIQSSFKDSFRPKTVNELSKRFLKEMQRGNVNEAIKILTNNMRNVVLPITDETLHKLRQKHPESKEPGDSALLTDEPTSVHPIKFEMIDAEMVRSATLKTKGSARPSGLDADGWRRILTSGSYGGHSVDLCKAFADVVNKLYTQNVDYVSIEPLLASRLLPLDKNPGLRPIGVGEIVRRIAGKVVTTALRDDITVKFDAFSAHC